MPQFLSKLRSTSLFGLMGRSPLFRDTYEEKRPPQFSFFVKPTQGNYDEFIHLLDKMLSDNINIASFDGDIERQGRIAISVSEFEVRQKASISMLDEWLSLRYPTAPPKERLAIIKPLKEVRTLRQKPAHRVGQDVYDRKFYTLQDELIWKVYKALHNLRCLLATGPFASSYEPPYWIREFPVKGY